MQNTIKAAALAFAASGMALATPAASAPASHGAPTTQSAYAGQVLPGQTAEHHKRWHRNGPPQRYSNYDRYDRYDRYDNRYNRQSNYYGEPVYRDTRIWRDQRDGRYYCRKQDGTTGLLIGGAVGALAGRELAGRGDRTLGTILGAAGGALLGRAIDRSNARCR